MSYNNYYMRLRVKAVQEFDRMYHEPEYKAKCHKRVWKRLGCYIFGISYQSYLDYLKMDVSDVPPTPLEAQQAKRKLVDKLLERELQVKKQPVRRKEPEEVKKRTCRTGVTPTFQRRGGLSGPPRFFRARLNTPGLRRHPRRASRPNLPISSANARPGRSSPARRRSRTIPRLSARSGKPSPPIWHSTPSDRPAE